MQKYYKCICGREFDNPQKFNGHKSNCEVHLKNKGTFNLHIEKHNYSRKCANIKKSMLAKERKQQELKQWISEKHICEKCGKVMTEKFGSGRFCSRKCSNSRIKTEEVKNKVSQSLKGRIAYTKPDGSITFVKSDDVIDKSYQKGNFKLSNCDSIENFTSYLNAKKIKIKRVKKSKITIEAIEYLNQYNQKIFDDYQQFLFTKAKDKDLTKYSLPSKIISKYYVIKNDNCNRSFNGYLFTHIALAQAILDRELTDYEIVHHINRNKLDNRADNIIVFDSKASHAKFHYSKYYLLERLPDTLKCTFFTTKDVQEFYEKHEKEKSIKHFSDLCIKSVVVGVLIRQPAREGKLLQTNLCLSSLIGRAVDS